MASADDIKLRKKDHIDLAFQSRVDHSQIDHRFYYEPLLASHPETEVLPAKFLDKTLKLPVWVSSMTGGTEKAAGINENLARACGEFGMGMGLGSCRALIENPDRKNEFDVRQYITHDYPLFGNLGIAQVEEVVRKKEISPIQWLVEELMLDGMIIHLNPLQEWLQPEGDRLEIKPLQTITDFLLMTDIPIIVKEVGQGMGRESLKELLKLPLAAVDFGASGGTNFSILELLRGDEKKKTSYMPYAYVGHTAEEMLMMTNSIVKELGEERKCDQLIISGGIKTHLDGYYLINKSTLPALYGQASSFLKHAMGSYSEMQKFVRREARGLVMADAFLKVR